MRIHFLACALFAVGTISPGWAWAQKPGEKAKGEGKPAEVVDKEFEPLVKLLKDKDAKVRTKAAEDIGTKGEAASSTATALCDALLDKSPKVAQAALISLEKVRPELYKHVSTVVLDSSRVKQFEAIGAIGAMADKALPAKNLLLAKLRVEVVRDAPIRDAERTTFASAVDVLLDSLKQIDADEPEVVKLLRAMAAAPNQEARRLNSIDRLVAWAGEDEERRKAVLPLIGAGLQSKGLLVPCVERLGKYGELSKGYLPAVKKLKLSSDQAVREAATTAVDAIEK